MDLRGNRKLRVNLKPPQMFINRENMFSAILIIVAVIPIAFCGWTLFTDYTGTNKVTEFSHHIAESEFDLSLLSNEISSHMQSRPVQQPQISEYDAWMYKLVAYVS